VELEAFLPDLEALMADCFQLGGFQSPERSKMRKRGFADEKRSGSDVMLVPDGGFQWSTLWGLLEAASSCFFMAYSVCMGFEMQ
jgi:hypothetical protein